MVHVLVTGATGYIGGRLVPDLLAAGHKVRCLVRSPEKLAGRAWTEQVEVVRGDLADADALHQALAGVDAAYYLIHSMGSSPDFALADQEAARSFATLAGEEGLSQIVYLGGLGDDADPNLSPHLRSRHEVGRVLAAGPTPVTELRAAVILGSGSASFEMLRALVEVLPVMVTPRWVNRSRCQPIGVRDVLFYLVAVLDEPRCRGRVLELGMPEVLTYREMMVRFAGVAGLRRRLIIPLPVLTPNLSAHWLNLVTPLPMGLARPLVQSLVNDVVVTDRPISDLIPHQPLGFDEAVASSLARVEDLEIPTRWSGADLPGSQPALPDPSDPRWAGGKLFRDRREVVAEAPAEQVWRVLAGIGGERGWPTFGWLWAARGFLDRMLGGVGLRRGRRHPDDLAVGDALDFWRVVDLEPARRLRLRAEMLLPGTGWLEWELEPLTEGRTRLRQLARFAPRGLWGRAYWYLVVPFHGLVFQSLVRELARRAEAAAAVNRVPGEAPPP